MTLINTMSDLHSSLLAKTKKDTALTEKANLAARTEKEMCDVIELTKQDLALWEEVSKDDAVPASLLSDVDERIAGLMNWADEGKMIAAALRRFAST